MKFTEGYWEKNERANASYAMQAFTAEAIPGVQKHKMNAQTHPMRCRLLLRKQFREE